MQISKPDLKYEFFKKKLPVISSIDEITGRNVNIKRLFNLSAFYSPAL